MSNLVPAFLAPAIRQSRCFEQGLPGGPYGHYVLRVPPRHVATFLEVILDGDHGEAARSRALIEGTRGLPRLWGFPVEWEASCEDVELVPFKDVTKKTLLAVIRALLA